MDALENFLKKGIQNYRNKKNMNVMKTTSNYPNAWIARPNDKGRMSIKKGNKVFLKKDSEFLIELFNPLQENVLSDIRVNGQSVCEAGLVIRPGQREFLDCFVDSKRKFIFKTYEVEDSYESKKAIEKNGNVEIFFYKEEINNFNNWRNRGKKCVEKHIHHHYNYDFIPYGGYYYTNNNGTYCTLNNTINTNNSTTSYNLNNCNVSNTSNVNFCADSGTLNMQSKNIETGRIEQGEESKQQFEDININFEKNILNVVKYQILPESRKPKQVPKKKKNSNEFEKLRELKNLLDDGIISINEFEDVKSQLLEKIKN